MHCALLWLLKHNPHYSNVTINQHALESRPIDCVPSDIMTVASENDVLSDEIISRDLGPSSNNIKDEVYNETTETSSFMLCCEKQKTAIYVIKINYFQISQWTGQLKMTCL